MANGNKIKSRNYYSSTNASLDLFDSIRQLAESRVHNKYVTYDELLSQMRRWWCQYYKRPYKDPLLDTYTFEELAFEYFDLTYVEPKDAALDKNKVSAEVEAEDRAWADAEAEAEESLANEKVAAFADESAEEKSDIMEEAVGLSDEQWAAKYDSSEDVKINPTADEVDEGGNISTSFEE